MIQIPNDEQLVFDTVAEHLLKQGKKSLIHAGGKFCGYRGIDGTKCAAGCLIPDNEYSYSMEGLSWTTLGDRGLVSKNCKSIIVELQNIHDLVKVEEWFEALRKLALKKGLDTSRLLKPMKEETMWLADYNFSGRVPNNGYVAAVAICNAMEIHQVFSLTDGVIGTALMILRKAKKDWDKKSLLKTIENCSFEKSEEVPL